MVRSMQIFSSFTLIPLFIVCFMSLTFAQDLESRSFKVVAEFDDYEGRSVFKVTASDSLGMLLSRGETITFDLSDSSLVNHPFNLSEVRDGIHSDGTAVNAFRRNNSLSLTLTSETPSRLYFFCDVHSGMGDAEFFSISGDTANLFQSDYNEETQELYIPRIYVDSEPPTMYSVRLGLSSDNSAFQLISASEGSINRYAASGRRQATYDTATSEIRVPLLMALGQLFQAIFKVDSGLIKLSDLRGTEDNAKMSSETPTKDSSDQGADIDPSSGYGSY